MKLNPKVPFMAASVTVKRKFMLLLSPKQKKK